MIMCMHACSHYNNMVLNNLSKVKVKSSDFIDTLPNIRSIEIVLGSVQLNTLNCLFRRGGISFRPPPGRQNQIFWYKKQCGFCTKDR